MGCCVKGKVPLSFQEPPNLQVEIKIPKILHWMNWMKWILNWTCFWFHHWCLIFFYFDNFFCFILQMFFFFKRTAGCEFFCLWVFNLEFIFLLLNVVCFAQSYCMWVSGLFRPLSPPGWPIARAWYGNLRWCVGEPTSSEYSSAPLFRWLAGRAIQDTCESTEGAVCTKGGSNFYVVFERRKCMSSVLFWF